MGDGPMDLMKLSKPDGGDKKMEGDDKKGKKPEGGDKKEEGGDKKKKPMGGPGGKGPKPPKDMPCV